MMEEGRGGSPCVSPGHAEFSEGTPTTAAVFGVALESHLLKQLTGVEVCTMLCEHENFELVGILTNPKT